MRGPIEASSASSVLAHLVLHEPEIPNNTGTIGRMCVALGFGLHLVHPLGFGVGDRAVRRAGLDYWPRLRLAEQADWDSFVRVMRPERVWFLCAHASRSMLDVEIRRGDVVVLGSETRGLPASVLDRYPESRVTLPMLEGERSLNLAVVAGMAAGQMVRSLTAFGDVSVSGSGRLIEPSVIGEGSQR